MSDQLKVGDDVNVCDRDGERLIYRGRIVRETPKLWHVAHLHMLSDPYPARFRKSDLRQMDKLFGGRTIKAVPR